MPLLRVARSAGRGRHLMVMLMGVLRMVAAVMVRRQEVLAAGGRGHGDGGGGRGRSLRGRGGGGQELLVAAQGLVVAGRAGGQGRQRRRRAALDAGRRHRGHDYRGALAPVSGRLDGRRSVVGAVAAVMIVPRAVAVPAHLPAKTIERFASVKI